MLYAYARAHTNGLFRPFVSVCCVCFVTGGFFVYSLLTLPTILLTKTELSFKLCQEAGESACRGDNETVCENSLCGKEGFSIYFFFFFRCIVKEATNNNWPDRSLIEPLVLPLQRPRVRWDAL